MMELTQPCLDAMRQSEGFSQFLKGVFDARDEEQILTVTMDRCSARYPVAQASTFSGPLRVSARASPPDDMTRRAWRPSQLCIRK